MKAGNRLFAGMPVTIFETMSRLAAEHGAINLGQGFPEAMEPDFVLGAAAEAIATGSHQYPPMMGVADLRQAVAEHNRRFYGLDVDWQGEVMVTSGATEALADSLLGLIEPGDEVVLIEPLYDSYLPIVRLAGGVPKLVRIAPPHWELPRDALRAAFSAKTKLILLNSPANPAGKVYTRDELAFIAGLLEEFDALAVCDEVYEHITFDGRPHVPLMTLPGMRERCVRIGSAGKTFSVTGWKVGYVTAAPRLLQPIAKAHQFLTFTTPPHLQAAVALGLRQPDAYFEGLAADLQARRDRLTAGLDRIGFGVVDCGGTYFVIADIRPLGFSGSDAEFCRMITTEAGVAAVPVSAFYQDGDVDRFVRFCFAKRPESLDEALARLARHFG